MGLLEALENFRDNLPHAIDGLKDLRREFKKDFGSLAREGAELFTLGFEEMVIKDNNDWKSSYEYLDQARQLVADARTGTAVQPRHEAAIERLQGAVDTFEKEQGECWEAMNELLELLNTESQDEVLEVQWLKTLRRMLRGAPGSVGLVAADLAETLAQQAYAIALVERGLDGPFRIKYSAIDACSRAAIREDQEAAAREYAAAQAIAADTATVAAKMEGETERLLTLATGFEHCAGQLAAVKQQWMAASNRVETLRSQGGVPEMEMVAEWRQRSVVVAELLHSQVYDSDTFSLNSNYVAGLEGMQTGI
jgi:hypothetical protein